MPIQDWFDSIDLRPKLEIAHFFTNEDVLVGKSKLAKQVYLEGGIRAKNWDILKSKQNDRKIQWCALEIVIDNENLKTSAVLFEENVFTKVRPFELQDLSDTLLQYTDPFDVHLAFYKPKLAKECKVSSAQIQVYQNKYLFALN